jgi:hypothetical protein
LQTRHRVRFVAKDTLRTHPLVHGRASTAEGGIVLKHLGVTYVRYGPGVRSPIGHSHREQEAIYDQSEGSHK